ncbi:hypothetical protein BRC83_02980 [Halobacteriales archaeon QS_1_68_17]|nr:MAG: hypothetical protein BRC83_02980 [Halobacteriales archaeon QS_1_68_17]
MPVGWHLPRHARVVVYRRSADDRLLTVYDCGASASPSARFRGRLVRVDADSERRPAPHGYVLDMREPSVLERASSDSDRWHVTATD